MNKLLHTSFASLLLSSTLLSATLSPNPIQSSLVIYNDNMALVHEKKKLNIKKDDTQIIYKDVASTIVTDSVNITFPKGINLYSQQYRFDKLSLSKLLDAHIGKKVDLRVAKDAKNFKTIRATLLSAEGSNALLRTKENKIISANTKNISFNSIPKELLTKPSLVWNVTSAKNQKAEMGIDYLLKRISWKSDYILNVQKNKANLTGFITIDNRSGKAYKNTELHLLAGDVAKAAPDNIMYKRAMVAEAMYDAPAPVAHQAHEGYHFYSIPFKVDISNNEKTQVKFLELSDLAIKREYTSQMSHPLYLRGEQKHQVSQHIKFKNKDHQLPKGIIRTYSKLDGKSILLGENNIAHKAKDSTVDLKIGKNFDTEVKEIVLERDEGKRDYNVKVKYHVKNASDTKKRITLYVPFNKTSFAKVKTKQKYKYQNGSMLKFELNVAANKTKKFEVRYVNKK